MFTERIIENIIIKRRNEFQFKTSLFAWWERVHLSAGFATEISCFDWPTVLNLSFLDQDLAPICDPQNAIWNFQQVYEKVWPLQPHSKIVSSIMFLCPWVASKLYSSNVFTWQSFENIYFIRFFFLSCFNAVFKNSKASKQNRLSKKKYIMSVRFTEIADKILIVYDQNTLDGIL